MVTELTTYAIDAEFAFYGPIAFDVSKMIANLLIAYFASAGYQRDKAQTAKQQSWLLEVTIFSQSGFSMKLQNPYFVKEKAKDSSSLCIIVILCLKPLILPMPCYLSDCYAYWMQP